MQNLDTEGCARVADLLRSMPQTTVLLVAQANTPTSEVYVALKPCLCCCYECSRCIICPCVQVFDAQDTCVKRGGTSFLESVN